MADIDILDLFRVVPFFPDAKDRVNNEINRMKEDMEILLSTWTLEEIRSIFTGKTRFRCRIEQLQGETLAEKCRSALRVGGFTFLTDAIHLSDFEMAERLRQTKMNVFSQLTTRDKFFRPKKEDVTQRRNHTEQDDVALFDLLRLPPEMVDQIMQRSSYKDAQSLAITCSTANKIYRKSSPNMLLPDIILILDFSSGELSVRWLLEKEQHNFQEDPYLNDDRILAQNKENEKKKNQLLRNTTLLKIVTTDDFEPEYCEAVRNYIGNRLFKRIVIKGYEYTENMKMMVEMFDKDAVELEVNKLTEDFIPFPDIKTISIRDTLSRDHGERLFAAKQFINITCALNNIDTFRKALRDWDSEQREIGRWVILKQFTIFQTPFGRRHRASTSQRKGYLEFISELNNSQMPHGEITEYVFHEIN